MSAPVPTDGTAAAAFSASADDADEVDDLVLMPEGEPDDEEDVESNADAETARLVARARNLMENSS